MQTDVVSKSMRRHIDVNTMTVLRHVPAGWGWCRFCCVMHRFIHSLHVYSITVSEDVTQVSYKKTSITKTLLHISVSKSIM